jgi:hypothetical protein
MTAPVSEGPLEPSRRAKTWPYLTRQATNCIRLVRTLGFVVLDGIAIAAVVSAAAIAAGFSGTFRVGPWLVSATSTSNPITIAAVALVIRSISPAVPFLGLIPVARFPARALAAWHRVHDAIAKLTVSHALLIVGCVMAASLALKLALAYRHPGFWTGDDVEIHEMTFARLFRIPVRPWELRSPFYPMGVIYPIQFLLAQTGQTDPAILVFAGRAIVACCTIVTLWLTFQIARRLFDSVPIAVLSVLVLATNKLHVMTGTTELPRPVASAFVLAAFWVLSVPRASIQTCGAGALIACASAMRFSEEVFLVPAALQLLVERRGRDVLLLVSGFMMTAVVTFGLVDALYWGEPFFSVRHIIEFTLVQGQSTRGFQPWYEYIRSIPAWANVGTTALALSGTVSAQWATLSASNASLSGERRASRVLTAWAWLPAIALSLLPHKETRYLVPILPFFAMLAAAALWQAIGWLRQADPTVHERGRERLAWILAIALLAIALTEPVDYVLPRTDDGVAVAQYIAEAGPTEGVAAEQVWNIGGRIYLPASNPLIDIDPAQMTDLSRLDAITQMPNIVWLVLQDRDVKRLRCEKLVNAAGFDEVAVPGQRNTSYRLYQRR